MNDRRKLTRIHRVRTLQLGLAAVDEAAARERHASELALANRITQLADAITPAGNRHDARSFGAAAYYRDRLHQSAVTAGERVRTAERQAGAARDIRQSARRDQNALERLLERVDANDALKELRALEDLLPTRPSDHKVRHGPC